MNKVYNFFRVQIQTMFLTVFPIHVYTNNVSFRQGF